MRRFFDFRHAVSRLARLTVFLFHNNPIITLAGRQHSVCLFSNPTSLSFVRPVYRARDRVPL